MPVDSRSRSKKPGRQRFPDRMPILGFNKKTKPNALDDFFNNQIGINVRFSENGLLDMRSSFVLAMFTDSTCRCVAAVAMDMTVAASIAASQSHLTYDHVQKAEEKEQLSPRLQENSKKIFDLKVVSY